MINIKFRLLGSRADFFWCGLVRALRRRSDLLNFDDGRQL
jgi:hypothetical protein